MGMHGRGHRMVCAAFLSDPTSLCVLRTPYKIFVTSLEVSVRHHTSYNTTPLASGWSTGQNRRGVNGLKFVRRTYTTKL